MGNFELLAEHIRKRDPYLLRRIIRRLYEGVIRCAFFPFKPKFDRVIDEHWDYLIILDACRYDAFAEFNPIKGALEKRISGGSNTIEWLTNNFNRPLQDAIYIAGNPYVALLPPKYLGDQRTFFKVEHVWDYGWDDQLKAVPPQEVTQAALKTLKRYPDKRLIIHYLQPHAPFISPNTKKLELTKPVKTIMSEVMYGKLNVEEAKEAWIENLLYVLEEIKTQLLPHLQGKVVITADHGEAFGEKGIYFHPKGIYIKELIEVPWLVVGYTA